MNIQVTGKQVAVSEALKRHAERRLASGAEKYFGDALEAHVVFSKEAHAFRVDCQVHVGHGILAHSHALGSELSEALDAACDRLEKRLRRYKRRLRDHGQKRHERQMAAIRASAYVLEPEPEAVDETPEREEPSGLPELVVDESLSEILALSVAEAVMRLDLGEQPVLMFRNESHGRINLVYRRTDGRIGWIDPAGGN